MTDASLDTDLSLNTAKEFLRSRATRNQTEPMANSVFALAVKLFAGLDDKKLSVGDLKTLTHDVEHGLLTKRLDEFIAQHETGGEAAVSKAVEALTTDGFDAFSRAVSRARGGIVFTAHPTFALSHTLRQAMAAYCDTPSPENEAALDDAMTEDPAAWASTISLKGEHTEVQSAISHAQGALTALSDTLIAVARAKFPNQWRSLQPTLPTIASWVGYDLDGRTDIHWGQSVGFRLTEKAEQLGRYRQALAEINAAHGPIDGITSLEQRVAKAQTLAKEQAAACEQGATSADNLVAMGNALTQDHPDRLVNASEITAPLSVLISDAGTSDDLVAALISLRAQVESLQLGTGRIHLRLNAAQMTSVIRRDLNLATDTEELGRQALKTLAKKASDIEEQQINFADLYFEQSTARRQFMMCAQILKHIDGGSPIRFLIAESENPATVMGALYLARRYGVAEQLDISPLFETSDALETGGRFIGRLLDEPVFMEYVRERGHLSVQLGFSDAGRFVGQIAADMAIERIHNLIGKELERTSANVGLLIFNTHGESMGRGAYPGSFSQRFDHLLSPWSKYQLHRRDIPITHEMSFQGGDGFLHFGTDRLAKASMFAVAKHLMGLDTIEPVNDPFYTRTDFVWDFYRNLRKWHEALFGRKDYEHLLSDFAGGFLSRAGSRPVRRASGARGPSSLRAISHNATLQQLGVPLNSSAGLGSAMPREFDQLVDLINESDRMAQLVKLALTSRLSTSVPSLRAYGEVFNPSLWVGLAQQRPSDDHGRSFLAVHDILKDSETTAAIASIGDTLATDLLRFDALLAQLRDAPPIAERHEARLGLHVLHATRQAAMMRALHLGGQLPPFSDRHARTREDVIDMIHGMRLAEAVDDLKTIFPASRADAGAFDALQEKADHQPSKGGLGYDGVHRDIIQPLAELAALNRHITQALSHAYRAYG